MARIKKFDVKSEKNRERVRKYRQKKKLNLIHEKRVQKLINAKKNITEKSETVEHDEPNNDRADIFKNKLKNWSMKHRISAQAINELLQILIFAGFHFLPKDSRTMMGTPKQLTIKTLSHGRMWYNGVEKCLENVHLLLNISKLTLDWNFDGLPIFKSSNVQFWPILASVRGKFKCLIEK